MRSFLSKYLNRSSVFMVIRITTASISHSKMSRVVPTSISRGWKFSDRPTLRGLSLRSIQAIRKCLASRPYYLQKVCNDKKD